MEPSQKMGSLQRAGKGMLGLLLPLENTQSHLEAILHICLHVTRPLDFQKEKEFNFTVLQETVLHNAGMKHTFKRSRF